MLSSIKYKPTFKTCGKIFKLKKMPQLLWQKNHFENFATSSSLATVFANWAFV
jgi:hypothetical protein